MNIRDRCKTYLKEEYEILSNFNKVDNIKENWNYNFYHRFQKYEVKEVLKKITNGNFH